MNRREALLALLGLAFYPPGMHGQSLPRIGVIHSTGATFNRDKWGGIALIKALEELGYNDGRNIIFDFRVWQKSDEVPDMVRDLIRLKVDVIVAASPPTISAAKSLTDRIPIVFVFSADPVATGLVRSLNRPGGNLTGFAWDHGFETYAKQLELLKEALPNARRIAVLWDANPDSTHDIYLKYYADAAPRLGIQLIQAGVRRGPDIDDAFKTIRREKAQALVVMVSAQILLPYRDEIMAQAIRNRLPTLVGIVSFPYPGAIFQSAPNHSDYPKRMAAYIDRILKGAKPGELPVQQPNKYELLIDLKAARALGVTVPQSVLVRADKVVR